MVIFSKITDFSPELLNAFDTILEIVSWEPERTVTVDKFGVF